MLIWLGHFHTFENDSVHLLWQTCIASEMKWLGANYSRSALLTCAGDCICRAGIDLATVEVRMNQLKVEANIAVGSRGNPTVTNTVLNIADVRV